MNIKKYICTASLILNAVFLILVLLIGYKNREKLLQAYIDRKDQADIVLFGDSNTKGGNWNVLLDRNDVRNSGFGAFTTSHLCWVIQRNVVGFEPYICFIQGGINDIGVGIPLERIKQNYKSLIDTIMVHDIIPVVQSTFYQEDNPESKIMVDSLNNFLIRYCDQKDIRYLNINAKLSGDMGLKPEYSKDGTHLNEEGYLVWAAEINRVLEEIENTEKIDLD